jgi:hypothetical protein
MGAPTPQAPYQALYRACIKDAAAHGAALMRAAIDGALEAIPQAASRTGDPAERGLLVEAAAALRGRQYALEEAFAPALLNEFAHSLAGDRGSSLAFETLPLLADEQVQDTVQLVRTARALDEAVAPAWRPLESLLTAAHALPAPEVHLHPLRPEVYVRSLQRAARTVPGGPALRRQWVRFLAESMAPALSAHYERIAQALRAQGLEAHTAADRAERATQITIRELQGLLAGEAPAGAAATGEKTPNYAHTEFAATVPASLQLLQEMRQVDQVMLQLRQRQAAMPGREADSMAAFRAALREQVRRPAQALGLEVVHLMVENIAGDPRLLPPVQEAVRELEPALLRLALADPRFFSDRSHPARRLLDEVTQRSLAWSAIEAPGFAEFADGLQEAVEALLETRSPGPEAFDIALTTLQDAWAETQPRGRRNREKAVRALLRAEQRNLLADRIAAEIRERPDAATAPEDALAFLTGPWAQVMAQARLADSTGAIDPGGYGAVLEALLWSVQPSLVGRVAAQHKKMVERMHTGLASIDHLPAETQRWKSVLGDLQAHAAALALGRTPEAVEPHETPSRVPTWLAPLEIYDSGFVPEQAPEPETGDAEGGEALPTPELRPGAWVDMLGDEWERWQLTWSSPHGMLFMFTHANGSTRSMTRRRLQQMMGSDALRLVSAQGVVDGALDAVARAAWRNSL